MNWIDILQQKMKQRLSQEVFDFIEGGADDELALQRNINAFKRYSLIPRILVDVNEINTKINLLGNELPFPLLIAPTAPQKLANEMGEFATVKAAANTDTVMVVSCMASASLESIAQQSNAKLWFQIHIFKNRKITENLIIRATKAGYKAIVVTVDTPRLGDRRRDVQNRFRIPIPCLPVNLLQEGLMEKPDEHFKLASKHVNSIFDPSVTWKDIEWLKRITNLPIILKGVLHFEDARIAVQNKIDGIIASNHGGRQLGAAVSPLDALPHLVKAVDGKIPVLMDGGIRSGTDIVKALALGAKAVLIGRPVLWALAAGGMHGIAGVIKQLNKELEQAMTMCGFSAIGAINSSCLIPN